MPCCCIQTIQGEVGHQLLIATLSQRLQIVLLDFLAVDVQLILEISDFVTRKPDDALHILFFGTVRSRKHDDIKTINFGQFVQDQPISRLQSGYHRITDNLERIKQISPDDNEQHKGNRHRKKQAQRFPKKATSFFRLNIFLLFDSESFVP